jgi:DNA mismatch repair protein MutS
MTQNLTALYQKFYSEYSAKYGPDTCIFLLVGKFYELYDLINLTTGQPATSMRRAIELMNIAIKEKPEYGPKKETGLWGGIPEQSLHKFAQVLTREGWTCVIVDQVKDNKTDTVIDRVPVRIISPGTHVETATSERMTIASLYKGSEEEPYSTSVLDLTTGEVFSYQSPQADMILHMFQVYCVKETVVGGPGFSSIQEPQMRSTFSQTSLFHKSKVIPPGSFQREEYFRSMFKIKGLLPVRQSLGLPSASSPGDQSEEIEKSLFLLLQFVEDHFPQQAEKLSSHELYSPSQHMRLSNNILEQLNILTRNNQRSVLSLLERTHSAIGKRALRERILRPITDEKELEKRWAEVGWATEMPAEKRLVLERSMKALYDLPRLHHKLAAGRLEAGDILQMFQTYSATACLTKNLQDTPLACPDDLDAMIDSFRTSVRRLLDEEKAQRRQEGLPVGFLTPIAGPRSAELEGKIESVQETWLSSWAGFCKGVGIAPDVFKLEKRGIEQELIWEGPRSVLKVLEGAKFSQRGSGSGGLQNFKIEAKKAGPIVVTCSEFEAFKTSLDKLWSSLNSVLAEESVAVCDDLWEEVKGFQGRWTAWLGLVDCTLALSSVATSLGWCRPSLGDALDIQGLRHPLLETAYTRMEYVKNSVQLGLVEKVEKEKGPGGWLIYGVNASGKSSLMKATGIACILAQAGSFVPADSMVIRPYDAAFSRIWNQDNLWAGLSSFAVEITEMRDILTLATGRSLVLGDEVCSGTESQSATALVASVLEYLDAQGAHFMFATHLHDLMKIPGFLPRPGIAVWHLKVSRTPEGKLVYDRTLQPGPGNSTYGLEVAKAMGIPHTILERAHEIRRALGGEVTVAEAPTSSWNTQIQRRACEVCGLRIVRDLEVHHITPRSEGGGNQLRNLVVLCETCHDKHHAGELEIGELRLTSDGLERSSSTVTGSTSSTKRSKRVFSQEETECIQAALAKHKGRPLTRILVALEEQGVRLTPAQLKQFQLSA